MDKLRLISQDHTSLSSSKSEKTTSDLLLVMEAIVAEANHDPQLAELATRDDGRCVGLAPPDRADAATVL